MRRLVVIILSLTLVALASGALEYLHDLDHDREDAALSADSGTPSDHHHPLHDETNCPVHAQLHLPMNTGGWVPLLVFLGVFVAFLSMLAAPLLSRLAFSYIDCRGPPLPA